MARTRPHVAERRRRDAHIIVVIGIIERASLNLFGIIYRIVRQRGIHAVDRRECWINVYKRQLNHREEECNPKVSFYSAAPLCDALAFLNAARDIRQPGGSVISQKNVVNLFFLW